MLPYHWWAALVRHADADAQRGLNAAKPVPAEHETDCRSVSVDSSVHAAADEALVAARTSTAGAPFVMS